MGLIWIMWRKSADRGKRKYSRFLLAANASPTGFPALRIWQDVSADHRVSPTRGLIVSLSVCAATKLEIQVNGSQRPRR